MKTPLSFLWLLMSGWLAVLPAQEPKAPAPVPPAATVAPPAAPVPFAVTVSPAAAGAPLPQKTPEAHTMTVVIFNSEDPVSEELARFYAEKRVIAADHVIGLKCPEREEITRAEYDTLIAEPLRHIFVDRGWWTLNAGEDPDGRVESSQIRFVALMRGVPLRIGAVQSYSGDVPTGPAQVSTHNEASVDSELAALGTYSRHISGIISNPYFRSVTPIGDSNVESLLLVGRLDAPTPELVRQMITDAIEVEQEGLKGFAYVDARGIKSGGLMEGDKWLYKIANSARRRGSPVILDRGEGTFPTGYPMKNAALYFGWYTENVSGPMQRPDFHFPKGAIAVHIHSFSAVSLRDPKRYWCAPLIVAGAAATIGNVAEPYLSLTPNLDIFHDRLRAGFTLVEAGWASERVLSWMTTFIGDPLYRPYPVELERQGADPDNQWDAYAEGVKLWYKNSNEGERVLLNAAARLHSGTILEGLGLLQLTLNSPAKAAQFFSRARENYSGADDILRVSIHEIIQLRIMNKTKAALTLVDEQLDAYPKEPAAEVLRVMQAEMNDTEDVKTRKAQARVFPALIEHLTPPTVLIPYSLSLQPGGLSLAGRENE